MRARAYRSAALGIAVLRERVTSGAQARRDAAGVGEAVAALIDEYLAEGRVAMVEEVSNACRPRGLERQYM